MQESTEAQTVYSSTTDDTVQISSDQLIKAEEKQEQQITDQEVCELESQTVDLRRSALEQHMGVSLDEIKQADLDYMKQKHQKEQASKNQSRNNKGLTEDKVDKQKKQQKQARPVQQPSLLVPKERTATTFIQNLIHHIRETNKDDSVDGEDHINIAERAHTQLGRFLDINAHTPFVHPDLGRFESVGGLWYFIKVVEGRDEFRYTYGRANRLRGRNRRLSQVDGFATIIADATWVKILNNPNMAKKLQESTLPFRNYFLYGALNTVRHTPEAVWYCAVIEECRATLQDRAAAIAAGDTDVSMIQPDFSFLLQNNRY